MVKLERHTPGHVSGSIKIKRVVWTSQQHFYSVLLLLLYFASGVLPCCGCSELRWNGMQMFMLL